MTTKITPGLLTVRDDGCYFHLEPIHVSWMHSHSTDKAESREMMESAQGQTEQANARFLALAWNAFVTAAEKLGVDPVELAEALGDGRLSSLIAFGAKPLNADECHLLGDTLQRLADLKLEQIA